MDKAQKNLIDTYFRKRKLAQDQDSRYDYRAYELKHFLDTGSMKSEDLIMPGKPIDDYEPNYSKVFEMLYQYPEYFDKLYSELNLREELSDFYVSELIVEHPEYIDKFDVWNRFKGWRGGTYINKIVTNHPELIDRFNLENLGVNDTVDIVVNNPKLINRFLDKLISKQQSLHSDDYIKLLDKFPQLKNKFEYGYLSAENRLKLLWYHPEVVDNLFKTYGDNMRYVQGQNAYAKDEDGYMVKISFYDLISKHPQLASYFK